MSAYYFNNSDDGLMVEGVITTFKHTARDSKGRWTFEILDEVKGVGVYDHSYEAFYVVIAGHRELTANPYEGHLLEFGDRTILFTPELPLKPVTGIHPYTHYEEVVLEDSWSAVGDDMWSPSNYPL